MSLVKSSLGLMVAMVIAAARGRAEPSSRTAAVRATTGRAAARTRSNRVGAAGPAVEAEAAAPFK